MHKIEDKLTEVRARISQAAINAGRNPDEITLLAVSKTQPADSVRQARIAGQRHFGENYLQEAVDKMEQLRDLDIIWHFIGPIQSNKTRAIAENFAWVHSVDRLKVAQRLSDQRPQSQPPINTCVQINVDNETTKSGVLPADAHALCLEIARLPHLRLRGLMAIPAPDTEENAFRRLRQLFDELKSDPALASMDTLSIGMSADLEPAIENGSTLVRIGTAIFGPRA